MSGDTKELYAIENGDRWTLVRDDATGRPFVRHQANASSGGRSTDISLPLFLTSGHGPEHQALWSLIDGLLQKPS